MKTNSIIIIIPILFQTFCITEACVKNTSKMSFISRSGKWTKRKSLSLLDFLLAICPISLGFKVNIGDFLTSYMPEFTRHLRIYSPLIRAKWLCDSKTAYWIVKCPSPSVSALINDVSFLCVVTGYNIYFRQGKTDTHGYP